MILLTIEETDTMYAVIAIMAIAICWGVSKFISNKNKQKNDTSLINCVLVLSEISLNITNKDSKMYDYFL